MKRMKRADRSKAAALEGLEPLQARAAAVVERLAAGAGAGRPAASSELPEAAVGGYGTLAFSLPALEGAITDDPWRGALIARLDPPGGPDPDRRRVEEEADWYRFAAEQGFTSPAILAVAPATGDEWGALVMAAPPETPFIDRLVDPAQAAHVLTLLAAIHARIHQLPAGAAPGPVLDTREMLDALADEIDRAGEGPDRDPALAWLSLHVPPAGDPVVCNGEVHPASLRVREDDPDGASPLVTNWSRATLADPEYDLGRTLVTLWATTYLATSRLDRSLMMMIRDGMLETYRNGYESVAAIDDTRLAFWQTFHARWYSARARSTSAPDVWDPLAAVPHLTPLRRGLIERAAELTHSFRL